MKFYFCLCSFLALSNGQFMDFFTPFYNAMQQSMQNQAAWSKAFADAFRQNPNGGSFEVQGPGGIPMKGVAFTFTSRPQFAEAVVETTDRSVPLAAPARPPIEPTNGPVEAPFVADLPERSNAGQAASSVNPQEAGSETPNLDNENSNGNLKQKTTVLGPMKCVEKTENGVRTFACIQA